MRGHEVGLAGRRVPDLVWGLSALALAVAIAGCGGSQNAAGGTTPASVTVSNPQVTQISANSATVSWTTNVPADSQIEYGLTTNYDQSTPVDPARVTNHSVTISNLTAATTYHYQVRSRDASGTLAMSGDLTLTTAAQTPTLVQWKADASIAEQGSLSSWEIKLPNPAKAGNCLIGVVIWGSDTATSAISDDKTNTWNSGPVLNDATNHRSIKIWYVLNAVANTQQIKVTISPAEPVTQAAFFEFFNVATASAADGASSANPTASPIASGSFTTTANGDLIFQAAMLDSFTQPSAPITWTPGSGFTPVWKDGTSFSAAQYQVQATAGAINPSMTTSLGFTSAITVAIALKAASAGSGAGSGIHVNAHHVQNLLQNGDTFVGTISDRSFTFEFPCTGNLIAIGWLGRDTEAISSISSSPANAWTASPNPAIGGSGEDVRYWYAANATCSTALSITITFTFPPANTVLAFVDISGAATSPFDVSAQATGNSTASSTTITGATLTPTTANGLVLSMIQEDGEAATDVLPGAYQGMQSNIYHSFHANEDGGYAAYYNPTTAAITFSWTYTATESPSFPPIGNWYTQAVAFKGAGAASTHNNSESGAAPSALR